MPTAIDRPEGRWIPSRLALLAGGGLIVLAGIAAYHNSLSGPFIFDDVPVIRDNETLRHLWPLGPILSPQQGGMTTSGRPVLNLSFALNHALGGVRVWGYHATNVAIHLLAGLALFGVARRTLRRRGEGRAFLLGLGIALIWTVHPLLTEAVTYTVQRAESLMGMFYLLTLYCFIRSAENSGEGETRLGPWAWLAILACLLGMATKEVMVSAPVIALLYDRTFLAGSFRRAFARRWRVYAGLAATWVPLAYFVLRTHNRGGTAGLNLASSITAPRYWLTQFPAIALYLKLAVWPHPLALDYGAQVVNGVADVLPHALVVLGLAAGTLYLLFRRQAPPLDPGQPLPTGSAVGFCGFFFFAILAPTSLIPIISQTVAEHRMYLALAPIVAVGVVGLNSLLERCLDPDRTGRAARWCFGFCLLATSGYGLLTERHNDDYSSEVKIWSATVATYPMNSRTQYNLGIAYQEAGNKQAAVDHFQKSLKLDPNSPEIRNNLGVALSALNRWPEAMAQFKAVLKIKPDYLNSVYNLGNAEMQAGDLTGAIALFERAIRLSPEYANAYYKLGMALLQSGRPEEALAPFERALRLKPDYAEVVVSRGVALGSLGRLPEAIEAFKQAARIKPEFYAAHMNLAHAYLLTGQNDEAQAEFAKAARLDSSQPAP